MSGDYTRAATTRERRLHESCDYTRAATTQEWRLHKSGDYTRAATTQERRLHKSGDYTRAATTREQRLHKSSDYTRAATTRAATTRERLIEQVWHFEVTFRRGGGGGSSLVDIPPSPLNPPPEQNLENILHSQQIHSQQIILWHKKSKCTVRAPRFPSLAKKALFCFSFTLRFRNSTYERMPHH